MKRQKADSGETDFFRPAELRAMLEAADDTMRPIIALQGLAGIRLQEAQRLTWQDVFGTAGHVAISATKSKTRSRRLVEICPALAAWLEPYRQHKGPLWSPVGTNTLTGGSSCFDDPRWANYPGRFYRLCSP